MLNNLQVLRAFAAFSVVFLHLGEFYSFPNLGSFGVDIFFVISGFIMARVTKSNSDWFLLRRIIRIVPIYWAFTIPVFILALVKPSLMYTTTANWGNLLKSLFFIPYVKESGMIQPILFVGWTLNYEMYFYLVLALCLKFNKSKAPIWAACLIAIPYLVGLFIPQKSILFKFYASSSVLEFIAGIGVFYLMEFLKNRNIRISKIAAFALCIGALLFLPFCEYQKWSVTGQFPFMLASATAVTAALLLEQSGFRTSNPFLILLGDASYVLYLSHPFVLIAGTSIFHLHQLGGYAKLSIIVMLAGITIVAACFLHQFLEKPLMKISKHLLLHEKSGPLLEGFSFSWKR